MLHTLVYRKRKHRLKSIKLEFKCNTCDILLKTVNHSISKDGVRDTANVYSEN